MKKFYVVLIGLLSFCVQAQELSFSDKIGKLMELATAEEVNIEEINSMLKSMPIDGKDVKVGKMNYSIYEDFEGETLYYIPFTTGKESRFSVEQLTKDGKRYYGMQFLLDSSYTLDQTNKVTYNNPDFAYNCNLDELKQFCTTPMKYKNNKGNQADTPLLSCIYTNPKTGKRLMYWVVCEKPLTTTTGNTIKEIKIQSIEFWR